MSRLRFRFPVVSAAVVGLAAAVGAVLVGQTPPEGQTPVFRAGVNLVSVDVYPRRDGQVVEGLTAGDFQVFEDGQPQKVEAFEFIRIAANPLDAERRDPSSQAEGEQLARDPRTRLFIVYLDTAHLTFGGSAAAHRPVVDFLTRTIGANDLFAVMTAYTPSSSIVFGRRTETIEGELSQYARVAQADINALEARSPIEERLLNCALTATAGLGPQATNVVLQTYREDLLMSSLEGLMSRLRDLRDERKNILFVSEGWVPQRSNPALANLTTNQGNVPTVGVGPGGRIGIGQSQDPMSASVGGTWCDQMFARLASLDFERRFRDLLTAARRANVSFYPVDVAGLRVVSGVAGPVSTLQTLAENTDGLAVVNSNDIGGGVRRISDNLAAFYLLRYYSSNSRDDGRYRTIEVKVSRPGVQVRARQGYFALSAGALTLAPAPVVPAGVETAFASLAGLREGTEVAAAAAATASGLDVVTEISAAAFSRPAWQRGAAVRVTVSQNGAVKATSEGSIPAGQRSIVIALPVSASGTGPWRAVVDVTGPEGVVQAQAELPIRAAGLLGDPTLWRGTPSPRVPLRPVADARLGRTERLRVQWPVRETPAAQTARLIDVKGQPRGGPLPFASLPAEARAVAVDLPLSGLPEGDYAIELVVTGSGLEERQVVAFRVVR